MSPSLSIVVTGRNDNYGGRFILNLRQFLLNTSRLLPEAEIILVEWNPPRERAGLRAVWPEGVRGKIITVPPEINAIDNPRDLALLEYRAKNVGIRRAQGDFILATNSDTIVSPALAAEIKGPLDPDTYYRSNRTDIRPLPEEYTVGIASAWLMSTWAKDNALVAHRKWGSYCGLDIRARATALLRRLRRLWMYRSFSAPHENAAGDFLLASKHAWAKVGGYPEQALASHIDSVMMCLMHRQYTEGIFKGSLYHQDHARRPFLKDPPTDLLKASIMRGQRRLPSNSWGLPCGQLEEENMPLC